ncbi:hypothetical protein GCM10009753_59040 [Streptantibioticus ferralitis]
MGWLPEFPGFAAGSREFRQGCARDARVGTALEGIGSGDARRLAGWGHLPGSCCARRAVDGLAQHYAPSRAVAAGLCARREPQNMGSQDLHKNAFTHPGVGDYR